MSNIKATTLAAAIAGSMMLAGTAQAADYGTLVATGATVSPGLTGGVQGGVFNFQREAGGTYMGAELLNGPAGKFIGFCIELGEYASSPVTYTVTDLTDAPSSGPQITAAKATDIAMLVGGVLAGSFSNVGAVLNDNLKAAAFQLALWEIINETAGNSYDTTADWVVGGTSVAVREKANEYLGLMAGATAASNLFALVSADAAGFEGKQDYLVQVVPIPAAAWLLGSGLLGLFGLARRKKVAAAA